MATQHISSNGGTNGTHHTHVSNHYNESALVELNETISRLSSHQGVEIVQVLNKNGDIVMESSSRSQQQQQQQAPPTQQQQQQHQSHSNIGSTSTHNDDEVVGADSDNSAIANGNTSNPTAANIQYALFTKHIIELATTYFHSSGSNNSSQNSLETTNQDQVSFIHIRSKNGKEMMISPHEGYVLTVLKR